MMTATQFEGPAISGKLRNDLQISQQTSAKGPCFVVRDPLTTKIYMFSETAFKLLQQITPEKSLEQTIQEVTGRTEMSSAMVTSLQGLIGRAQEAGLFSDAASSTPRPVLKPARRKFNPFFITIPLLNVESILNIIGPVFRPLFSLAGFVAWAVILVSAFILAGMRWPLVRTAALHTHGFYALTGGYGLFLALTVVHEFGHAIACFKFGIKVREMGVLMYFFQPCAYCNISNAWMESSLKKRLIVSLGGIYFESFLWGVVTILWALSPPAASWHRMLFLAGVVLLVRALINLFPFFTLDGYYILSDLVKIPNLRPKSFVYLLSKVPLVRRFIQNPVQPARWERIVLLAYGTVSTICLAMALGLSAYTAHKSLLKLRPQNGNVIFWGLFVIILLASLPSVYSNLQKFSRGAGARRQV